MNWRGNIIGMFLFVLLGGRLFGEKPPFSLIKPGSETSLIDWSAAIPQFQSLVVHQIDGGRVVDVKPVTFAVSINELRVVETMSCVIEYLQRPEPGKSAPNVRILGFFYRFPYEFNSEWNLCVNDNQRESDDGAGKGWISIDKEKFKIQHFLRLLRSAYAISFWPPSDDKNVSDKWVICALFLSGLSEVTRDEPTGSDLVK